MRDRSFVVLAAIVAIATAVFVGCPNPLRPPVVSPSGGSLAVHIGNNINARTLLPPIDMTASTYTVSGTGPGGATFSESTAGDSLTIDHLAFGSWTVTVDALNSSGTIIGSGQGSAKVNTGETTTLAVTVVPLSGNGSLEVSVTWPASQVEYPSIQASLTPASGSPMTLDFDVSGGTASYSSSTIPAGYWTLSLELLDNGIPVMGAVEVARIVTGQTTSGTYSFANVNQPGGTIQVAITPALADPIPVSIGGVPSTVTAGTSVTATASVSDGTTNETYVWYLNGESVGTGASYTIPGTTAAGYYRLDVTAFSADGSRAGSASASFEVTAQSAATVYAGGSSYDGSTYDAGYWMNGTWTGLSSSGGSVTSLAVSGSDVYAAGGNGAGFGYWTKGTWVQLISTSGGVSSIAVSGTEVYLGGYVVIVPPVASAFYWTSDGSTLSAVSLSNPYGSSYSAYVTALVVTGSDIYAGGYCVDSSGGYVPGYWKDGGWVRLGSSAGTVSSLVVSGSDVYAGGYSDNGSGVAIPGYWKDGAWVGLSTSAGAVAALVVSGSDVYAAGSSTAGAGYWKNGTWTGLDNTGGIVTSLVVNGSDVYAGGTSVNSSNVVVPGYWKNGSWVGLSNSAGTVKSLVVVAQ